MKQKQTDYRSTYQTGSTNPPKNHYNRITVLLIVIVVVCSAVTIAEMLNQQMIQSSASQDVQADADTSQDQIVQVNSQPLVAAFIAEPPVLGLTCEEMDNLYRVYHQLPHGLYISQVEPGSVAHQAGLQAGDVLIACNDTAMTKKDRFLTYIDGLAAGTDIRLTVFRNKQQLTISLTT